MRPITTFFSIFCFLLFSSQKIQNNDNSSKIDFFSIKYDYLDENYKIKMPTTIFNQNVIKYKINKDEIKSHKDSMYVVMMAQFDDWQTARKALYRVTYSHLRLSYHLWISEHQTKKLAEKYGFSHAYRFKKFLLDEKNHDENLKIFFSNLRKKLIKKTGNSKITNFSILELTNFAMQNSPERIRDYQKNTQFGKTCSHKSCCQHKKKECLE